MPKSLHQHLRIEDDEQKILEQNLGTQSSKLMEVAPQEET